MGTGLFIKEEKGNCDHVRDRIGIRLTSLTSGNDLKVQNTPPLLQVFLEKVSYSALVIGTHLAVGKVVVEPKFSAAIVDQRSL